MASNPFAAVNAAEIAGSMYGPNPYSQFQGRIPFPAYAGVPTDALGRPIQQAQGTTLNSTPAAPQQAAAPSSPFANVNIPQGQNTAVAEPRGGLNTADWNALTPQQRGAAMGPLLMYQQGNAMMPSDSFVASGSNPSGSNPTRDTALAFMNNAGMNWNQMVGGGQAAPSAPQIAPGGFGAGTTQNAASLLSNPGPVVTPGATVPQSTVGSQPSVLQQFLANQKGGTGAGNYSNQGFFNTLNALRGR
jgi:hypothetical protein